MSADVEDIFPLLPGQLGMLVRTLRSPGAGVYIEQRTCTIEGEVDVELLRRSWQLLVDHHAALRTSVHWSGLQQPVQVVRRTAVPVVRVLEEGEDRAEVVRRDAEEGFALDRAPLFRLTVLPEGPGRWFLMWTVHHVILDGWSATILLQEFFSTYSALARGVTPLLPPRPRQRAVVEHLLGLDPAAAREFWTGHLAGFGAAATIRFPGAHDEHGYERSNRPLPARTSEAVREFAARHRVTAASVYFAAWQLQLAAYSGADDLVTGVVSSGRGSAFPGADRVVGLLLNTLPVRTTIDPDVDLASFVRYCHDTMAACAEHDRTSLIDVHDWCGRPSGLPLFESLFVVQNFPFDRAMLERHDRWRISDLDFVEITDTPLCMMIVPGGRIGDDGVVYLSYDTAHVPPRLAGAVIADYERLLDRVLAAPAGTALRDVRATAAPLLLGAAADSDARPVAVVRDEFDSDTERGLAAVWSRLLGFPVTSPDADFFDLGGQSLLAMRIVSGVRGAFGVTLPVEVVFQASRLADCAKRIAELVDGGSPSTTRIRAAAVRSEPNGSSVYRVSPAQLRLWFLDQLFPGGTAYAASVAVEISGPLDDTVLWEAISTLTRRHDALRSTFTDIDGIPHVVVHEDVTVPREVRHVDPAGLPKALTEEARRPLDLRTGPLLRVVCYPLEPTRTVVQLCLHHMVSDEWSMKVMLDELVELYEAGASGRPPSLPVLASRYVDYAQHQWDRAAALPEEVTGYWRDVLRGVVVDLALPGRRPRPAVPSFDGGKVAFELGEQDVERLRGLADERGTTLFVVLGSAVAIVLAARTGTTRFALGTPVADRPETEFEPLVGLMVDTVPFPVDVAPGLRVADLVDEVGSSVVGALTHAHAGFDRIVDASPDSRSSATNPLFQVLVSLHEMLPSAHEMHDLALRWLDVDTGSVQFDLGVRARVDDGALRGVVEFARDLYDEHVVEGIAADLVSTLRSLPDRLGDRVDELFAPEPVPGTTIADTVTAVWRDVLGAEDVDAEDDFFTLGGDSISLLKVKSRLAAAGHPVSLQVLYSAPRLADLAAAMTSAPEAFGTSASDEPSPPTGTQRYMLDQATANPDTGVFLVSAGYAVDLPFDVGAMRTALAQVIALHPALRTSFHRDDLGGWTYQVHDSAPLRFTEADLSALPEPEAVRRHEDWLAAEQLTGFAVDEPGLVRWSLTRMSDRETRLGVVIHHAVIDGMSLASLVAQVLTRYRDELNGVVTAPPTEDPVFPAFTGRTRPERTLADALPFWRAELHTARPHRLHVGGSGHTVLEHPLPDEVVGRLRDRAGQLNVSLRLLLLAAHISVVTATPLATPCRGDAGRVVTGLLLHSRDEDVPDDAVGNFLNPVPLVLRGEQRSWRELVRAAQVAEAAVFPHLGCQFPDVQRALGLADPFAALFNYVRFRHAATEEDRAGVRFLPGRDLFPHPVVAHFRDDRDVVLALQLGAGAPLDVHGVAALYTAALTRLVDDPEDTPW
ncbi:condensation domain-containing protein [Umezawaea endophytica]|uniref:Condensation domain-containing protein n=1 Tax=Umezawaea endophytica TaxID=1654476 RepID=A0A9X2VUI8_9PSEU|nr:condensation domain-containing protein [Umezawaea endophytica]MCS7482452.1 condensation domain-containing protein [Umezawaea endophytica]